MTPILFPDFFDTLINTNSNEIINRKISDKKLRIKIITHINKIVEIYEDQLAQFLEDRIGNQSEIKAHFELKINNVITDYDTGNKDQIDDLVEKVGYIINSLRETYEYHNKAIYLYYVDIYNDIIELYVIQENPVNP
tara:strand:+ start:294 stop:704 length:411 start_codon:yes stop_codon:yes gene_type:complete